MTAAIQQARNAYRRILDRSERTPAIFNAAVEKLLGADQSPVAYLEAARRVRFACERCAGTGIWAKCWDVTSGKPRPSNLAASGTCYRCQGSGAQDDADRRRNYGADCHALAGAV